MTRVRWHVADPLSLRHLEEMMAERGVSVDGCVVVRIKRRARSICKVLLLFRGRRIDWRQTDDSRQSLESYERSLC
jgi:transposase-like protein